MPIDWSAIGAGAVSGSIFGAIASLLAPWSHWGVEKRRGRLEAKRQMIVDWRAAIEQRRGDIKSFRETPSYASLRNHLPEELIQRFESKERVIHKGGRYAGLDYFAVRLLDEIARLEHEWELV